MKLFEITVTRDRLTVRRQAEQQLTAGQKTAVLLTVIICAALVALAGLLANA